MVNVALTLCYQTDAMMHKVLLRMEQEFVEQGGIKERMHVARTGYR
jgi:four helix bundle suffix protein